MTTVVPPAAAPPAGVTDPKVTYEYALARPPALRPRGPTTVTATVPVPGGVMARMVPGDTTL
jgi:hypothetical protein